jgi:DNA-binding transcriptional regulator YiaG
MSLSKRDRKVQAADGKIFPIDPIAEVKATLAIEIANALRREFGDGPLQVKRMARLMGINPRTVKNWLQTDNGPNGAGLVVLMRHSKAVTDAVLLLADRRLEWSAAREAGLRQELRSMLRDLLDHLGPD